MGPQQINLSCERNLMSNLGEIQQEVKSGR
jgi:hypothetical protein